MKQKTLLLLLSVFVTAAIIAQKPGVSGGISAGANYSKISSSNESSSNISWKWKWGGVGGFYLNFPLGNTISLQPSVLFSQMGGKYKYDTGFYASRGNFTQKLGYLSIPTPLKIKAGNSLAVLVGPQFDFLLGAKVKDQNDKTTDNKDNFSKFDFALTGGLQLMAYSPVSVTVRYIQGVTDLVSSSHSSAYSGKLHNSALQATVNFRLFGGNHRTVAITTPEVPVVETKPVEQPKILDTDNDGIPDSADKCPTVPGVAKYNGCPVPDTDGDGIDDEHDKCPTVAGLERYQGCPIPDSDNDGVNDEEDNCPHLAGPASNHGCPLVDQGTQSKLDVMAKGISWSPATGYKLSNASNKSLDQVANMLTADPNLKLTISVHTDNMGNADNNKTLSQNRADALKAYLVSKGVKEDQITATGYGGEQPIADNKTAAGRAKNKRVELKLHY